jgi:hypothetical protein
MEKESTFSPMQVKNKPRDGETEHAFILEGNGRFGGVGHSLSFYTYTHMAG